MWLTAHYQLLFTVHVGAVTLSGALFVLRGLWMLRGSAMLQRRWVRVLPHVVDTLLLLSAVSLALAIRQYPFVHAWLTAKLLALPVYVVLGSVALKRGRSPAVRRWAFAAALATFAYIVATAIAHDPAPWST